MESILSCPVSGVEKLLLATDGSQFSEGAIREAINFAKKCSSRLFVISVLETNPEYVNIGANVFEREKAEAIGHLESVKKRAMSEGVECETIFYQGAKPYQYIVNEAAGRKADMIIIGRRGRKGLAKILLGEEASKIIGYAPCKVLVVPRAAHIGPRNILVATDGSDHSAAAVIEAISIAKRCGSRIIALSAMRDSSEDQDASANVRMASEMAKTQGIETDVLTPVGRSYDVIAETAGGRGVDLIVIGAYGEKGLRRFIMGSSTEKVISMAGCAVLVVKAQTPADA